MIARSPSAVREYHVHSIISVNRVLVNLMSVNQVTVIPRFIYILSGTSPKMQEYRSQRLVSISTKVYYQ